MAVRLAWCAHCNLDGHWINACHVKADGRREPDRHDIEATELVYRLADSKGRIGNVEARRHIARALRREARRKTD